MEIEQDPIAVEEQSWLEGEDKRDPVEHNSRRAKCVAGADGAHGTPMVLINPAL